MEAAKGWPHGAEVLVSRTQLLYAAGWPVRECSQWDERGQRFLVSRFEGGIAAVPNCDQSILGSLIDEQVLVAHPPRPGLSNLGFRIDYPRNRVVSCATDKKGLLRSTIVAYDYTTWETLFVVELAGPGEAKALADDLAIHPNGDIYVTDSYNGKIWKVKSDGSERRVFSDYPLFKMRDPTKQYFGWVRLNGICFHPDGFLLVAHTGCSALFKVSMDAKRVTMVEGLEGVDLLGDGLVLQNKNTMALSGLEVGVHLLVTKDSWQSATVTSFCPPPPRFLATSVSLKDGQIFAGFVQDPRSSQSAPGTTARPITNVLTIGQPIFRPLISPPKPRPRRARRTHNDDHLRLDGCRITDICGTVGSLPPHDLPDHYTDIYTGRSFPINE